MLLKSLLSTLFLISYLLPFTTSFRNLPMGTNTSTSQLQKRQFPTVYCGSKVELKEAAYIPRDVSRTCTLGFAVKRVRGKGRGQFNHGYLTLGDCVPSRPAKSMDGGHPYNVMLGPQNVVIGKVHNNLANLKYDPPEGFDYAIIKITEEQAWDNSESMAIATNDFNQPPLIRTLKRMNPTKGDPICYSGAHAGLVCGELVQTPIGGVTARVNPWTGQMNEFLRVGIVGLNFPPAQRVEDFGAPVFVPVYNQCEEPKQLIAAYPVGLLLKDSIVPFVTFRGLLPVKVPFSFYYQSLELILANEPNLDLLISPGQPNLAERRC